MTMKSFFLALLLVPTLLLAQTERKFVHTSEDFYIHTQNHVRNVNRLAEEVFEMIQREPEKYKAAFGIPQDVKVDAKLKKLLLGYIRVHDEAKLNTNAEFLKAHGVPRPVILELYSQYGGRADPKYVDLVNRVDDEVGDAYRKKHKIVAGSWQDNLLRNVEKFTDSLERGANPVTVEEMGRATYTESGSLKFKLEKLTKEGGNPEEIKQLQTKADLAADLEKRYPQMATTYAEAKHRFKTLSDNLKKAGLFTDYLDEFAQFEIIEEYEKKFGKISNIDDPTLINKFRSYLFETADGEKVLASRIRPQVRHEALSFMKASPTNGIKTAAGILNLMNCQNYFQNLAH